MNLCGNNRAYGCGGADCASALLLKNPGGGLAPIGGYIVGKRACGNAAFRLTAPGLGKGGRGQRG